MSTLEQSLKAAHTEVMTEIARTDNKTALLLAFVGVVLAAAWTVGKDVPLNPAAALTGSLGVVLLLAAAGLLLRYVRRNLKGRHGFPLWATLTTEEIRTTVTGTEIAADIAGLSRLAVLKFTCLRRAVDLIRAGGALLVLAALITARGAL